MKLRPQVIDRIFLSSVTYVLAGAAVFSVPSLMHAILMQGQFFAMLCLGFLVVVNTVAAVDTVINDLLPPSRVWHFGIRCCQTTWLLIAVTYAGLAWVSGRVAYGQWVAAFYTLFSLRCVSIAFIDLWLEFRETVGARREGEET